jgi:hypothetical protein
MNIRPQGLTKRVKGDVVDLSTVLFTVASADSASEKVESNDREIWHDVTGFYQLILALNL